MRVAAGVDVGGTFTDVVVVADGRPMITKVPTTPADQSEAVATGLATVETSQSVALLAHGTTTATNAVLERATARTVLVTTAGFADVLTIARQDRPSLYDLTVTRPAPLVPPGDVVTAAERMGADGEPVVTLTSEEVTRVADAVAALAPASVALCLLFGYANSAHEDRLAEAIAERLPGAPLTRSSRLLPEFREYERASTTVMNAGVAPVMQRYLARLGERLPATTVTVMTSGGGTAGLRQAAEAPVHTLLSGPAAGVVAAGRTAGAAGYPDAVALDMGGTSTDVCLIRGGRPDISTHAHIGGLPLRIPAVAVHTVGAGGGSVAWIDAGGALRVGPQSAGAVPGPACYGRGGVQPTVTDAHAALGDLDPHASLGSGAVTLDVEAARESLTSLPTAMVSETVEATADGVLTVVRATMARALRRVTTEQGVDPAGLALVAYGGAGPLHATALARELGCAAVVIPPTPGVLSALGLLLAPPRAEASQTVMTHTDAPLVASWEQLDAGAREDLAAQGVTHGVETTWLADCRYRGQSHELRVPVDEAADVADAFHTAHRATYGYAVPGTPVEVVTLRVVAEGRPALEAPPSSWDLGPPDDRPARRAVVNGETTTVPAVARSALNPGDELAGPALVDQPDATTRLGPGDRGRVDEVGNLVVVLHG